MERLKAIYEFLSREISSGFPKAIGNRQSIDKSFETGEARLRARHVFGDAYRSRSSSSID